MSESYTLDLIPIITCPFCRIQLIFDDGSVVRSEHGIEFDIEHYEQHPAMLEQDFELYFCPNNAKRFHIKLPYSVEIVDCEDKTRLAAAAHRV